MKIKNIFKKKKEKQVKPVTRDDVEELVQTAVNSLSFKAAASIEFQTGAALVKIRIYRDDLENAREQAKFY